eukprot:EG_transcript_36384
MVKHSESIMVYYSANGNTVPCDPFLSIQRFYGICTGLGRGYFFSVALNLSNMFFSQFHLLAFNHSVLSYVEWLRATACNFGPLPEVNAVTSQNESIRISQKGFNFAVLSRLFRQ